MHKVSLSKTKIETKLAIIREAVVELEEIGRKHTGEQFINDREKFAVAEHYLRRALEAVFDIGGHIISRFPYSPSKRPKSIKEIAIELGNRKIVDSKFAEDKLVEMAGYRNRLVHFYDEITPRELYQIITEDLGDLEIFAQSVVRVVNKPDDVELSLDD
ncbi:MAG: DUF86 domain-containing protein [Parcubacteria group bacterium]|nr:DUF86 domain-containing protein [Parcubacteria group bacterium]